MKYTVTQRTSPESDEPTLCNALTIDVEDYYQVSAFEADIHRDKWGDYPQRVQENTFRLLEKLAAHNVSGTFFIVGWVAEKYPELVREIRAAGHEVGSHSYWHRLVYQLTPEEFRSDLRRSRDTLENILGESVRIYRAPSFSITRNSLWAFEILLEERFQVDSSVFPVYHDRYGLPDANPAIHRLETRSGSLWECPPSVRRRWGINVPVSGGGYFRLYPLKWSIRWLRQVNKRDACPFVFYVHPWEIDPEQPRLQVGSRLSRWRHYLNLATTEKKLDTLLDSFRFGTLTDAIRDSVAWKSMATNEPSVLHKLGGIVVSSSLHETGSTSR